MPGQMGCDCGGLSGGQAFATIGCHHPTWPNPDSSQTVSLGGSFPNFCGSSFHSCHSFLILCVSPLVKQITMIHNEYSWAHGFSFFQLSTCFRRTQKKNNPPWIGADGEAVPARGGEWPESLPEDVPRQLGVRLQEPRKGRDVPCGKPRSPINLGKHL